MRRATAALRPKPDKPPASWRRVGVQVDRWAREIWSRQALLGSFVTVEELNVERSSWVGRTAVAFGLEVSPSLPLQRHRTFWYFRLDSSGVLWWSNQAFCDIGVWMCPSATGAQESLFDGLLEADRLKLWRGLAQFRALPQVFDFDALPGGPVFKLGAVAASQP
jgi:hypothetical protein